MVCQRREKEKWVYSKLKDQEVQKLNIQLSYDPAIPLWGTNPDKIIIWYVHPYVHSSIIYNSQDMETNYMSINRGMDKEYMVHKNNGMLFSHKKNEVMPFVAMWKDLEMILLNEASKKAKDKHRIISLVCGTKIWHKCTYW